MLFFLLIPFVLIAFGLKVYQEYQFAIAKKSLQKTKKKSAAIKAKVAKQEAAADKAIAKADEASDRRKAREESDKLNLDWHKDDSE